MRWGTGATPVKISPSFTPTADYAIKFGRALSGASFSVDRGQLSDVHRCSITVSGDIDDVNTAYQTMASTIADGVVPVVIEAGEWIFGPATKTSALYQIALDEISYIERTGLNSASFTAQVSGTVQYDSAYTAALPAAFIPSLSHTAETASGKLISRMYTATNSATFQVPATFAEFVFAQTMNTTDAARLQLYYETANRGAKIAAASFPAIKGVEYPWGLDYGAQDVYIRALSFSPMSPSLWRVNVVLQKAQ